MKKSDNKLIKEAIDRLHKKNSGDYESLLRQVENRKRVLRLNFPQLLAGMSTAKTLILEWGRGTGKTTFLGDRIRRLTNQLPRGTSLFVGPTYKMILTRILPSLIQGLEMFGIYENLHYFVCKPPPTSWRNSWGRAYQPPRDYSRYITFWNGFGAHLVSQDVPGDGRGLNSDAIIGDEAALLSKDKLEENTDPTLRGTKTSAFIKAPLFASRTYMSSTPITQEGMWLLDYEGKAMSDPNMVNFISADCRENLHNLRPGYLDEARANALSEWIYLAEYENVRPKMVKEGFYPLLNATRHAYEKYNYEYYQEVGQSENCSGDRDLIPGQPLILGVDFGAAINCMTVNQYLKSVNTFFTLKDFYVLGAEQKIQDHLIRKFHDYYRLHQATNKEIFIYYDASGNHRTGITSLTRAQLAAQQLESLGWSVKLMTITGSNPLHEDKHVLWNMILKEDNPTFPKYRINKHNCRDTWISMTFAKAIPSSSGRGFRKDKSSERSSKIPRQHATDLSDANDNPIFGMFFRLLAIAGVRRSAPDVEVSE